MNMATVKVLLRMNKLNEKGLAPLYLRLIKDRKAKFISLKIYIKPSEWNEEAGKVRKSHPNSARMNAYIAQRVADAEGVAVELETKSKKISSHKIKEKIIGAAPVDFFPFAEKHINKLKKEGNYGSYKRYESVIEKLKRYCDKKPLYFDDITVTFLQEYEEHLRTEYKNVQNTIHGNLKIIRKLINDAIRVDIITHNDNPFYRFQMKLEKTTREYLTEDELKKIEKYDFSNEPFIELVRNMYVFAVYAGGLRISDVMLLKWSNYDGERINVQTRKTKSFVTIKLPNKAIEIMNLYKQTDNNSEHYIFPILNHSQDYSDPQFMYTVFSSATTKINKKLKLICKAVKINKVIGFHTSRHTFATWALRKGIRIEYVSKLLGHASIKETQGYAKIVNEELDKAMEVFN